MSDPRAGDGAHAPLVEAWTLSCEQDGRVLRAVPVVVRGQQVGVDLEECSHPWNR